MIQINKFEPGLVVFGRDREGTAQVPGPQVLSSRVGAQGSLPALSWIETWRSSIALPLSTAAVILQAPAHLIGCLVQFNTSPQSLQIFCRMHSPTKMEDSKMPAKATTAAVRDRHLVPSF